MDQLAGPPILPTASTVTFHRRSTAVLLTIVFAGMSPTPITDNLSAQAAPRRVASAGIELSAARSVPTRYWGDDDSSRFLERGDATPLALAAADFDEDGVADLVGGYAGGVGGIITLHRGNVDSLFPNAPAAQRRRAAGRFSPSPFAATARAFAAPAAPDFLHAGDFDGDTHADVLIAAAGGEALLLRGDGKGGLGPPERIELPGTVTAMAVGDINEHDGSPDVVFGIVGAGRPQALVYAGWDGALKSAPDAFELPSRSTSLALGHVDDDGRPDVVVAAGTELLVIHGRGRKSPATISSRSLSFSVASMAVGEFTGDRRTDLALVSRDGDVHLLANAARATNDAVAPGVAGWHSDVVAQGFGAGPTRVIRAWVGNRPTDDLLVLDGSGRQLHVLTHHGNVQARAADGSWNHDIAEAAAALPMRLNIDARDDLVVLRPGHMAPLVTLTQADNTFVVVNTNDSGQGSLRQAILDANTTVGNDLITFAIPGAGPHTITPLTPLPAVEPVGDPLPDVGSLVIDATTQPGFAGSPVIELSGAAVGTSGDGLEIKAVGCVVRGFAINRFAAGVRFSPGPFLTTQNFVVGNYIGTDVTGTAALGNSYGVAFGPLEVFQNTVGGTVAAARNVISGNGNGVWGRAGNTVQGNFIGTDATGTVALGNDEDGVVLFSGFDGLIGGTTPGARNIISGNGDDGVVISDTTFLIANNYIGTDSSGGRPLANAGDGIEIGTPNPRGDISGNVVSANGGNGINVSASDVIDGSIRDNRVGTNSAGTLALGNVRSGIVTSGSGQAITGNVISGNHEHGLLVSSGLLNTVQGNVIGTDTSATVALGNGGDGVRLLDRPQMIGGVDGGLGNVIAFNGGDGVAVLVASQTSSDVTAILSNSIFSNGGLGIDLGDDGVTPNDACDVDTGANNLQNFPVITAVEASVSSTTIRGQLNSSPSAAYQLQFFASSAADPSGFGEGARLLGSTMVTTDAACNATFAVTLPVAIAASHVVTATATDAFMSTSEFSNALAPVRQTPQEATRQLIDQIRRLVAQGALNRVAGVVLIATLRVAIVLMDRGHFAAAAQQLRVFNRLVTALVVAGRLGKVEGQALTDAANAIIAVIAL
jgi:hypothetical protein